MQREAKLVSPITWHMILGQTLKGAGSWECKDHGHNNVYRMRQN